MRARVLLLAAAVALAGCAGAGGLAPGASRDLQDRVAAVRGSVEELDGQAAAARLDELRRAVDEWLGAGELDPGRADEILAAAADVEAALALLPEPPVEQPSPTPTPQPEATVDDDEDDDDDDDGDGTDDNSGPGGGGNSGSG
ncbi:MAG: hypothetical protein ACRDI0_05450 [Actinomycetota bacterium]